MVPQDPTYCSSEKQARFRRRRLIVLACACAFSLALFGLTFNGPGDAHIEGNLRSAEASR